MEVHFFRGSTKTVENDCKYLAKKLDGVVILYFNVYYKNNIWVIQNSINILGNIATSQVARVEEVSATLDEIALSS